MTAPRGTTGQEMEMHALRGSARAVIVAMRKARPHADISALYQEYEASPKNKPIGWPYFRSVCRQVDNFTTWRLGKTDGL